MAKVFAFVCGQSVELIFDLHLKARHHSTPETAENYVARDDPHQADYFNCVQESQMKREEINTW